MNYVNYIQHLIYKPDTCHRRYDFDLQYVGERVKQIGKVALSFIGLYRPMGSAMSIGMNVVRVAAALHEALDKQQDDWRLSAVALVKCIVAGFALVATLSNFASGLFLITGIDVVQSGGVAGQLLLEKEYKKAVDELLQTLGSALYLGFMATGALEVMVAFAALQVVISLYQARSEFAENHFLEAGAKIAMALVRANQAHGYVQQIRKRDAYLQMQKMRTVFERLLKGKDVQHLIRHPLASLQEKIEQNQVVLFDAEGNEMQFGSHFHGNGGPLVKGENLIFRTKIVDGKEVLELDFKINHAFREHIDEVLRQLRQINGKQMNDLLAFSGSHIQGISIENGCFANGIQDFYQQDAGKAHRINLNGLGCIFIGASEHHANLYDRVVVQIDANRSLYELHEMLSIVDLDRAICISTRDDIERLKMGHLFRTFFPREATPFERTEEFFNLSLEDLKTKMIETVPEMESIFSTYYHKMKAEQVFNGRVRYRIDGLAQAAYEQGARALTAAITGAYSDAELFSRIASLLRIGMLAVEVRDENGLNTPGLGNTYYTGGADSVYTQLITEKKLS